MLWDTHYAHSFSGDSNADPAAMARSAIEKKIWLESALPITLIMITQMNPIIHH